MHCFAGPSSKFHQQTEMAGMQSYWCKQHMPVSFEFIKTPYLNIINTFIWTNRHNNVTAAFSFMIFTLFLQRGPCQFETLAQKVWSATLRRTKMIPFSIKYSLLVKYIVIWIKKSWIVLKLCPYLRDGIASLWPNI